jgi:hypothetical protein
MHGRPGTSKGGFWQQRGLSRLVSSVTVALLLLLRERAQYGLRNTGTYLSCSS